MSDREFEFTSDDFARIKKMVYEFAGIDLNESKKILSTIGYLNVFVFWGLTPLKLI